MPSFRAFGWTALLLSVILYRSGGLIKNCILIRSSLPTGYITNGEYADDCTPLSATVAEPDTAHLDSCEDVAFWELHDSKSGAIERPLVFGCDAKRKQWNTVMGPLRDPSYRGTLWLYVPTKSHILNTASSGKALPINLINYPPTHDFHPLGLEIWPSHGGNASHLYVVNHARDRTYVEQFVIDPSKPTEAVHIRSITHPYYLHSANALVLTSPDSFYVSNDHLFTRRLPVVGHVLPIIETVLALPLGFVSHITLNPPSSSEAIATANVAKPFIPFPNGVAVSSSGTEVVIVSTTTNQITFYEHDPSTHTIGAKKYSAVVPFSPDNVRYTTMDGKEVVIVGGHPNFPDITAVAQDKPGAAAGSWVVAIIPKDGADAKAEPLFDLEAPVSLNTKLSNDGVNWTLKTLFQSNGKEGGFGTTTTGLRDPDTGALYFSGLYAKGGVLACKTGSGTGKRL